MLLHLSTTSGGVCEQASTDPPAAALAEIGGVIAAVLLSGVNCRLLRLLYLGGQ